jgi:hypothetical protein
VTRVDGKWYVSPVRTVLDSLVAELHLFQRSDLEKLGDYVSDVFESMFTPSFGDGVWCNDAPDPSADPDTALTFDACLESPDGAVGG